jgi:hypothetical protein
MGLPGLSTLLWSIVFLFDLPIHSFANQRGIHYCRLTGSKSPSGPFHQRNCEVLVYKHAGKRRHLYSPSSYSEPGRCPAYLLVFLEGRGGRITEYRTALIVVVVQFLK